MAKWMQALLRGSLDTQDTLVLQVLLPYAAQRLLGQPHKDAMAQTSL